MLETLGIVSLLGSDAERTSQTRRSSVTRRLAGKSMLEWIVRRATDAQRLDGVVVLTGDSAADQELSAQVPADVPVHIASSPDPLCAAIDVIESFPCRSTVFVSADTPFVDPALIDRLVITAAAHPQCDYISYRHGDGRPTVHSQVGVFAEWCKTQALRRAHRKAKQKEDRQEITRFIYSHPDVFQIRLLASPEALDREDLRLRISCEEDWEHAATIVDALGEEAMEWQCIAGLLEGQPALRRRMAVLNQRAASAS